MNVFLYILSFARLLINIGMTPLLAACVTGHVEIVDYMVKSNNLVSRKEKIEALELLGATYIDKKRDLIGGFDLWKRAMDIRFNEDDEQDIPKPDNALPIEAYEWAQEVKNHEELNELLSEPDEMRMQVRVKLFVVIVVIVIGEKRHPPQNPVSIWNVA
jgi:hypothetical protein